MYASEPVDRLLEFMREKIRRQGVPLPQTDYPNYWQRNRRLCGRVGWQPPIKISPGVFPGDILFCYFLKRFPVLQ